MSRSTVYGLIGAILTLGLAACAEMPRPGAADTSNAMNKASGSPQSPNSLPPGDRVNSPIASPTGVVGRTAY